MTTTNSFVPPPELVQQWLCSDDYPWGPLEQTSITITTNRLQNVATQAAQWGADQELDACYEWLEQQVPARGWLAMQLRAARRPEPPTLKEQALADLNTMTIEPCWINGIDTNAPVRAKYDTIRRALEALDD
jgi:hypothetical protein